jgi:hypothetical protein
MENPSKTATLYTFQGEFPAGKKIFRENFKEGERQVLVLGKT